MKKRGFGQGMWNGSGGKPNEGESVEEAMKREVREELGVEVLKHEKYGELDFFLKQEDIHALMHAYLVSDWNGELKETEEMKPKWFKVSEVPYSEMWKSDWEWLPLVLSGKKIKGSYTFEKEGGKVLKSEVKVVEGF